MEIQDMAKFLKELGTKYKGLTFSDDEIHSWDRDFKSCSYEDLVKAYSIYRVNNLRGFPPNADALLTILFELRKQDRATPAEAWSLAYKAICRGSYSAEQAFVELPIEVQQTIGGASVLRDLARDTNFNIDVQRSRFIRDYQQTCDELDRGRRPRRLEIGTAHPLAVTDKKQGVEPGVDGSLYLEKLKGAWQ